MLSFNKTLFIQFVSARRPLHILCVKVSNNYCRMSDLTFGYVFCSAPKHMIRLSVECWQDSKIQIRL